MSWFGIFLAVAALVGSAPAIVAAARRYEAAAVVGILVVGTLGGAALVAGGVALMFNGYVEDTGMEPASTLHIAIPLLAIGVAVSAVAWRTATE